ncbi:amidohydrolase family protein [Jiulongibacter sediminis]|uniref:Amidohydrolase n=1 Tax=Jiulongibacter sediminis TaxID=1605367 RepID=A0A0P7BQQ7_9BACT|nr:amidohydrolase family protein [Jiulongibacter sediminis]KPM47494.1 amidohydrolase [Jiulongibacter sediminis]TBX23287.1 amidohydrolase [Jiulongibacter sediminis]
MIDAHHHFWTYDPINYSWIDESMAAIQKSFLPEDLEPILTLNGVEGSVLVQVNQNEKENDLFLRYAEKHDFIRGVVGWIDLRSENLTERLVSYQNKPLMKGFRHIVQGEPDDFLFQPEFIEGVRRLHDFNYTYDILIYERQLRAALHFIRQLPENKLIIDHIAKPDIKNKSLTRWANYMKEISRHKNVFIKVSGIVTEADYQNWKREDFYIYLDHLMEYFGPKRLIYGSDWPVCLVAAKYEEQLDILKTYFSGLSIEDQNCIFRENAIRFYNL